MLDKAEPAALRCTHNVTGPADPRRRSPIYFCSHDSRHAERPLAIPLGFARTVLCVKQKLALDPLSAIAAVFRIPFLTTTGPSGRSR